uniref:G-protein coupled receptors family 1 profile domain-containing protein n=1 Tax=Plectus sambesii TaxID=2011161 RepID=A0A914UTB4_9BILA
MNPCSDDENATECECVARVCQLSLGNFSSDLMEDCYLSVCFVSKRSLPNEELIPLTVFYFILFLTGLIGNLTTCIVIRTHPVLQTQTNRYLLNLALADLVTLTVGLPFEVYMHWNQYPWDFPDFVCHLKALIAETTSYVSVLTILSFSIERYIAICHSFMFVKLEPVRNQLPYLLAFIWVVALLSAVPFAVYHRADYLLDAWPTDPNYGPVKKSKMCMIALYFDPNLSRTFDLLFHLSAIIFFAIPLLIIVVLYLRISITVRKSRYALHRIDNAANLAEAHSQKVTVLLVAVVIAFFVCYAPFQLQRLLFFHIGDMEILQWINHHLYFVSGILFYLATIVNPILYNVMSVRFRQAFREVLFAFCHPRGDKTRLGRLGSSQMNNNHLILPPGKTSLRRLTTDTITTSSSQPNSMAFTWSKRRTNSSSDRSKASSRQSFDRLPNGSCHLDTPIESYL